MVHLLVPYGNSGLVRCNTVSLWNKVEAIIVSDLAMQLHELSLIQKLSQFCVIPFYLNILTLFECRKSNVFRANLPRIFLLCPLEFWHNVMVQMLTRNKSVTLLFWASGFTVVNLGLLW